MNIIAPGLFSLVFIGIGAAILRYGVSMSAKARQSLTWPTTEGEIAHSAVLYQPGTRSGDTTSAATFKADVSYRYKVDGVDYSSERIALLDLASSSGRAQGLVLRYPDGARVSVHYNPADHAEAVLEPGNVGGVTFLYFVGGVFAAAGLFFLLMSLTGRVHMAS
jgi:hypothetical protein